MRQSNTCPSAPGLAPIQVLTPLADPVGLATSPYHNAALVVSGEGDGIWVLDYDPQNAAAPFAVVGELIYSGNGPQLPGRAVMITRGTLTGWVFVAELSGVRTVTFDPSGSVLDQGRFSVGSGMAAIVGAIGVQP